MQATQVKYITRTDVVLAVSLELSKKSWKIALHDGQREKSAIYTVSSEIAAQRLEEAVKVIAQNRVRLA